VARDPVEATGWIPLGDYYREVSSLSAGVVPLADSAFNRAKSWLKGLEYAALGVPFVATPSPEYVRLQNEAGAGLLADKPKRWRSLLRKLFDDESMRWELAAHARDGVRNRLTIEANAWRWDEAWARAITHRHARLAA
jgi:glycosyltransferase involved in cell wall biosynthesis